MRVIIHGGAGGSPESPADRQAVLDRAANRGARADDPVAAVKVAINHLEGHPAFNAGVGGAVQSDGQVRTDAGIMTSDGTVGAVCSMGGVRDAISVADAVRVETPHVLLTGQHAVSLAAHVGIEPDVDLLTLSSRARWEETDPSPRFVDQLAAVGDRFGSGPQDTVGAVASDGNRVVAGTSTGGRWHALAGRVGDVPQVGCGFFASEAGGVSTTGAGEDIARTTLARTVVARMESGEPPQAATDRALAQFDRQVSGTAGLIALSTDGIIASGFTSDAMQTSVAGS